MGIFRENTRYSVLTDDGYQSFAGVSDMGEKPVWRVELENGIFVECTHDHKLFSNNVRVPICELEIGDTLNTTAGDIKITSIEDTGQVEVVYDLIEVENGHKFYANGILSSNCEFIVFEETLINSIKLAELKGIEPIRKTGQVRWYKKIESDLTYVAALDPSMGTGGDNAAITVWELPTMRQVAEWMHNKTPIEEQIKLLRNILIDIWNQGNPELYWSVETNTLGEAALVVIRDTGEDNFPGDFLHDPNRMLGEKNRRKGFVTTNKSKLEACAKLKKWVENGTMSIKSPNLISELKNFVAIGNSYAARTGMTDDLVSSTLIFVRMAGVISGWSDEIYDIVNGDITEEDDDYDVPYPSLFC